MVIKINPARVPVWRSPTSLQLGLGSTSIRLDNLTNPQEQLLQLLYRGVADAAIDDVARDVGASKSETAALVARVAPALIQIEEKASKRPAEQGVSDPFIAQAFAEIIRASFSTDRDGALVLANRASKRVFISELNRVGLVLLQALATAGIGEICTEDRAVVNGVDVGALAGVTSCLDCRITNELEADEGWAAMMTQLKFRTERLDDSQTALLCAGLALERTLSWVDSGAIGDNQATIIDHRTGRLSQEVWQIDPDCRCQQSEVESTRR